jgi:ATP-binding cassette subfamily B protein
MLQKLLFLSDQGYRDFKAAVRANVLVNLSFMAPIIVMNLVIMEILKPFVGGAVDYARLWSYAGIGLALVIAMYCANRYEYGKTYVAAYAAAAEKRIAVAEQLRRLPLSFFNQKDLTELTTNLMADCTNIEHTFSHLFPQLAGNIITIAAVTVLLCLYDWQMALAIFGTLPLSFLILFGSRSLQRRIGERHVAAKLKSADQSQEYLEGIKVIKAFGLSGEKFTSLDRALRDFMKQSIRLEAIVGSFVVSAIVILRFGLTAAIFVGVHRLSGGRLDLVKFVVFLIVGSGIYTSLSTIMTMFGEIFYTLISLDRMKALQAQPLMEGDAGIALERFHIAFDRVSFGYNQDEVIRDASFTIPQGKVTALVGPSGSGKSTVARLVARFWDVSRGGARIGDRNIREIDPEHLLSYIAIVFQDVVLFNDTVYNNIRIGNPDAGEDQVIEAARMAQCDGFIRRMPQGYQTLIGENGCTLSGGERQRISIARALLKNAPIVLLDEATASLDPENEAEIQTAISNLIKGRTVVVIAHRLRTVAAADQIIVLDRGQVVEQGRHAELMERDGLYARLYRIQQESLGWAI